MATETQAPEAETATTAEEQLTEAIAAAAQPTTGPTCPSSASW